LQSNHAGSATGANNFFGGSGFCAASSVSVSLGGSGTAHNNVQPTIITNCALFAGA
jgi:hypothetical protein